MNLIMEDCPPGLIRDALTPSNYLKINSDGSIGTGSGTDTGALLTLTAASASVNSADQTNQASKGIKVVVDITAITGTSPTLTVTLEGKDLASGAYYTILASAALTAVGVTVLTVFPGATAVANVAANDFLPKTWRVQATIGGTTPAVTATIGASTI